MKLKQAPTAADVDELKRIYRDLQRLTEGLHPAAGGHASLMAVLFSVRACLEDWTGAPLPYTSANAGNFGGPPKLDLSGREG